MRFSSNGKFIAASLLDNTIKVFYTDTLKFFLSLYGHKLPVMSIDISSDSTLLVSASADKNIKVRKYHKLELKFETFFFKLCFNNNNNSFGVLILVIVTNLFLDMTIQLLVLDSFLILIISSPPAKMAISKFGMEIRLINVSKGSFFSFNSITNNLVLYFLSNNDVRID